MFGLQVWMTTDVAPGAVLKIPLMFAAIFNLNHTAHTIHWHFISLSVSNVVVIVLTLAVFALAIALPFPKHYGDGGPS